MNAHAAALGSEATRMFQEAAEGPAVIARMLATNRAAFEALGRDLRGRPPRAVVTCARGSSDHAATYAKYLIETATGIVTASAALSVSSLYAVEPKLDGTLYIAISQSGRSPDLLSAVQAAKRAGALTLALVNDEASPLAELAHHTLPLLAGAEVSVAATKSYLAALAAIAQLTAAWTQNAPLQAALDDLPRILALAWQADWSSAARRLSGAHSLYVLARGVGFGAAQEAALKLKETCGLHAEAFSAAEVLHGPMALVRPGFPVLIFAQGDQSEGGVAQLARVLHSHRADVMMAGAGGDLPSPDAHPMLEPIVRIQGFYRMAAMLSVLRGYDPDRPPNLRKVTQTV